MYKKRGASFPACSNLLNQNLNYENLCFHEQKYAIISTYANNSAYQPESIGKDTKKACTVYRDVCRPLYLSQ